VKPVALERRGNEPVPEALRTTGATDLFAILFMGQLTPAQIVLGGLAVAVGGLSYPWATASAVIGFGLAAGILAILGQVGVDYGIPGQVALRATFGVRGSQVLTSPLRIITGTYWFAAQALASALAVSVIADGVGISVPGSAVLGVTIGFAQAAIALIGFHGVRRAARLSVLSGLTVVAIILFLLRDVPAASMHHSAFRWQVFAAFTSIFCGAGLTNVTNIADVCRYCRSRNSMRIGLVGGTIIGTALAAGIGAFAAERTGSRNPFAFTANLHNEDVLLVVLALLILVQATAVNSFNLYTVGMSVVNSIPSLGRIRATAVASVAAILLSGVPTLVTHANQWVSRLANITSPIAGVLIADYVIARRMHLDVDELLSADERASRAPRINASTIASVAVGSAIYAAVPQELVRVFWGIAASCAAQLMIVAIARRGRVVSSETVGAGK